MLWPRRIRLDSFCLITLWRSLPWKLMGQ
uniref:Uncharacterized protein n=1 Tax=Anguilla anguilla TaxID=7936 RepID=A0A0E9XVZ7_ANGAN